MVESPADALWAGVRRGNTMVFVDICLDDGTGLENSFLWWWWWWWWCLGGGR